MSQGHVWFGSNASVLQFPKYVGFTPRSRHSLTCSITSSAPVSSEADCSGSIEINHQLELNRSSTGRLAAFLSRSSRTRAGHVLAQPAVHAIAPVTKGPRTYALLESLRQIVQAVDEELANGAERTSLKCHGT